MCFSNELYIRIVEKHSLLLEDGFPDCGSYESLNVVLNFLEMMNAGHETGRNTGEVFFPYEHPSALKMTVVILKH